MITFEKVSKFFLKEKKALDNISFHVNVGETLVLLGTSGSGKTTALRMINKLIEPTNGRVYIENEDIAGVDPIKLRRKIGYAIQHVGLFEHMTIYENISIVLKLQSWSKLDIDKKVDELLELFNLTKGYKKRYPFELSGGEKQRIGVARAIANDPPIILMDEPFGSLDPLTREQVQNEFLELESNIKKTIVFVTHDILEAVKMADRIVLMDKGRIKQIGTAKELIENPKDAFVNDFFAKHKRHLNWILNNKKPVLSDMNETCLL